MFHSSCQLNVSSPMNKMRHFLNVFKQRKSTSIYKGVSWVEQRQKWKASIHLPGNKFEYGGLFDDELKAAQKVNEMCDQFQIEKKNRYVDVSTIFSVIFH